MELVLERLSNNIAIATEQDDADLEKVDTDLLETIKENKKELNVINLNDKKIGIEFDTKFFKVFATVFGIMIRSKKDLPKNDEDVFNEIQNLSQKLTEIIGQKIPKSTCKINATVVYRNDFSKILDNFIKVQSIKTKDKEIKLDSLLLKILPQTEEKCPFDIFLYKEKMSIETACCVGAPIACAADSCIPPTKINIFDKIQEAKKTISDLL